MLQASYQQEVAVSRKKLAEMCVRLRALPWAHIVPPRWGSVDGRHALP